MVAETYQHMYDPCVLFQSTPRHKNDEGAEVITHPINIFLAFPGLLNYFHAVKYSAFVGISCEGLHSRYSFANKLQSFLKRH